MDVQLQTRTGDVVHSGRILWMNPPPEIINWGARFFTLWAKPWNNRGVAIYREGIVWPMPVLSIDTPRIRKDEGKQSLRFHNEGYANPRLDASQRDPGDENDYPEPADIPCPVCEGTGGGPKWHCESCNGTGKDPLP